MASVQERLRTGIFGEGIDSGRGQVGHVAAANGHDGQKAIDHRRRFGLLLHEAFFLRNGTEQRISIWMRERPLLSASVEGTARTMDPDGMERHEPKSPLCCPCLMFLCHCSDMARSCLATSSQGDFSESASHD